MDEGEERYWLKLGSLPWQEATAKQFIGAERKAGFHPKPGCGPFATGGFSAGGIRGCITHGEIREETWGWDPEFIRDTRKVNS